MKERWKLNSIFITNTFKTLEEYEFCYLESSCTASVPEKYGTGSFIFRLCHFKCKIDRQHCTDLAQCSRMFRRSDLIFFIDFTISNICMTSPLISILWVSLCGTKYKTHPSKIFVKLKSIYQHSPITHNELVILFFSFIECGGITAADVPCNPIPVYLTDIWLTTPSCLEEKRTSLRGKINCK